MHYIELYAKIITMLKVCTTLFLVQVVNSNLVSIFNFYEVLKIDSTDKLIILANR